MNSKLSIFILGFCLLSSAVQATDVKGGSYITLPPFQTKDGATISATAVDGWSMKSAEVDNNESWTTVSISGNTATTNYIPESTAQFYVKMSGELIPPEGDAGTIPETLLAGESRRRASDHPDQGENVRIRLRLPRKPFPCKKNRGGRLQILRRVLYYFRRR